MKKLLTVLALTGFIAASVAPMSMSAYADPAEGKAVGGGTDNKGKGNNSAGGSANKGSGNNSGDGTAGAPGQLK